MAAGCAIYIGDNPMQEKANPFGKDIANRGLFRALIEHGPWDDQLFLVHHRIDAAELAANLFGSDPVPKPVHSTSIMNQCAVAARGVLFRGQSRLAELGWLRRGADDRNPGRSSLAVRVPWTSLNNRTWSNAASRIAVSSSRSGAVMPSL